MRMRILSRFLFWIGIITIPLALIIWIFRPDIFAGDFAAIQDPALREAMESASVERFAIFVGLWPPTLIILSSLLNKREVQNKVSEIINKY